MKQLLLLSLFFVSPAFALDTVEVAPLDGPIGTAVISPPNGSAVAYRMDFAGQKAVIFLNNASTEVYIGSHSAITSSNGFPLISRDDSLSMDLKGGTTIYFYGNGASADVRAIFAR